MMTWQDTIRAANFREDQAIMQSQDRRQRQNKLDKEIDAAGPLWFLQGDMWGRRRELGRERREAPREVSRRVVLGGESGGGGGSDFRRQVTQEMRDNIRAPLQQSTPQESAHGRTVRVGPQRTQSAIPAMNKGPFYGEHNAPAARGSSVHTGLRWDQGGNRRDAFAGFTTGRSLSPASETQPESGPGGEFDTLMQSLTKQWGDLPF